MTLSLGSLQADQTDTLWIDIFVNPISPETQAEIVFSFIWLVVQPLYLASQWSVLQCSFQDNQGYKLNTKQFDINSLIHEFIDTYIFKEGQPKQEPDKNEFIWML